VGGGNLGAVGSRLTKVWIISTTTHLRQRTGIGGRTWEVSGPPPTFSWQRLNSLTVLGLPIIGDGSGISNLIASVNGNGNLTTLTNVTLRDRVNTNSVTVTNEANGILTMAFADAKGGALGANDARFHIVVGGPKDAIYRAMLTSCSDMFWNPQHGVSDGTYWRGGEMQWSLPALAIGLGSDSGGLNYYNRDFQVGIGQDHHGYMNIQYDSWGTKTTSTNAYSNPLLFSVTSSNGNSVSPGLQGWSVDATGGTGHAGLRLWYDFDRNVTAEAGITGLNWRFANSVPAADWILGGGSSGGGLVQFYGAVYSTNFVGDASGLTNVNAAALFERDGRGGAVGDGKHVCDWGVSGFDWFGTAASEWAFVFHREYHQYRMGRHDFDLCE
jgi:hypothetical protein